MTKPDIPAMTKEEIIAFLKEQARQDWGGAAGDKDAHEMEVFLRVTLENYSKHLGISEEEILRKIEQNRTYNARNYYQRAHFPLLEDVDIFETVEQLRAKFPSKKFRCPACKGISTDPNDCDSGVKNLRKVCDWKSYGLFGCLDGGYRFVVKDDFLRSPRVHEIFRPIELEHAVPEVTA